MTLYLQPVRPPTTAITAADGVVELVIGGTWQPNEKKVFDVTGDTLIFDTFPAAGFAIDELRLSLDDGPELSIIDSTFTVKTIFFKRVTLRNNSPFAITPLDPVRVIVGTGEELLRIPAIA